MIDHSGLLCANTVPGLQCRKNLCKEIYNFLIYTLHLTEISSKGETKLEVAIFKKTATQIN